MQVRILSVFLLLSSSSLLFSAVTCDPNHHHNHNDFPWQNILSSLGIDIEKQTGVISNTEPSGGATVGSKEHYTSESSVEILKSEPNVGSETPIVAQNGTIFEDRVITYDHTEGLPLGYKIGIPIVSILLVVFFLFCICKCCFGCCQTERQGFVVMQSNTVQNQPPAPQIIVQQPIIHQQAPPMYDAQQRWAQPPPQGPPQWGQHPPQVPPQWDQPPQGPPQWAPHPMGQQQHYSPNSGCDNAGYNPENAPPPYNPGKY